MKTQRNFKHLQKEIPASDTDGHTKKLPFIINNFPDLKQGRDWKLLQILLELSTAGLSSEEATRREKANFANMIFLMLLPHPFEAQSFYINTLIVYGTLEASTAQNILRSLGHGGDNV